MVGTSFISPPNAARAGYDKSGMTLQNSFGSSPRRSGNSMTPRSIARLRPSTTPITLLS